MKIVVEWIASWTLNGQLAILLFIPFAVLLFFVSVQLIKYSEVIILKSRFGGGFVGGALIAAVTSLPELITEVVQSSAGYPAAGIADDIGSNAFSALLIAISLFIFFKRRFLKELNFFSKLTLLISGLLAFLIFILMKVNKDVNLGTIGLIPLSFFLIYLIMLVVQYKYDNSSEEPIVSQKYKQMTVKKATLYFIVTALILVCFALVVNWSATAMIIGFGIPESGVGGILLAITTSLPEVVAYFVFLRKKQPTAAVAALVGSHFFNLGISFFGDLAYHNGPTFNESSVGDNWPIALLTAIMMLMIFIQAVFSSKIKSHIFHLALPSIVVITYIVGWTLALTLV